MRRFTIRQQIYVFILALLAVIGFILVMVVMPAVTSILALQQDITKTHQFLEQRYENAHKIRQSLSALDEVESAADEYAKSALASGDELTFITQLEKIAELHQVSQQLSVEFFDQKKIAQAKSPHMPKKPHYRFSFSVKGEYLHVWQYLRSLELLPLYIKIDRMTWDNAAQGRQRIKDDQVTLRFDGIVYAK